MNEDEDAFFWEKEEEEKGCQICGQDDGLIMNCATCSLDRTCGECRAVTDCASFCKSCVSTHKD